MAEDRRSPSPPAQRRGGKWPLRELAAALEAVSVRASAAGPWDDAAAADARAAVGVFLLSQETMTLAQVEGAWRAAYAGVLETYARTRAPEAAMLAQNFVGLTLWRVSVVFDKASWRPESERLGRLVDAMTDGDAVAKLTREGLGAAARFGPTAVRAAASDWLAVFAGAAERALAFSPEGLLREGAGDPEAPFPRTADVAAALTHRRFALLYDFPFVQEGLRLVNRSVGWVTPFAVLARRAADRRLTPLTRVLFTVALVDRYFWGPRAPQPRELVERFAADCDELGRDEIMSPAEANATKRVAYEVRVSAAVAYADPFARDVRPGMAAARVRSDPAVLTSPRALSPEALAVHTPAALRLVSGEADGPRGPRADAARAALAASARAAWDAVQNSAGLRAALEALVGAGFVPQACRAYEAALKAHFARAFSAAADGGAVFDETQQAVGCAAVVGGVLFELADKYGPGLDYLETYTEASLDLDALDFLTALGLPDGAVEQIMSRCAPPQSHVDYVRATRAALVAEIDDSEAAARAGGRGGVNAARESLLLWFDLRAGDAWGISRPAASAAAEDDDPFAATRRRRSGSVPATWAEEALPPLQPASTSGDAGAAPVVSPQREAAMVRAAARVAYPEPMPSDVPELADPAFSRYVVATAVRDALTATASAAFSLPHLALAVKVLTWARDYGAPYVRDFGGHKAKLTALVSALLPFAGEAPQRPAPRDAANVEALLGELYATVEAAVAALPAVLGLRPPPRPDLTSSALLVSMHAAALRVSYDSLARRTEALAEELAGKAWLLADAAATAQAFFACRFARSAAEGDAAALHRRGGKGTAPLGVWRLRDLMAAVGDAYAACADVVADVRVRSLALRALAEETARHAPLCDALARRAAPAGARDREETGAARIFLTLGADFAGLARAQTSLDLHVRKLVASAHPPGMREVAELLTRWADVAAVGGTAPRGPDELARAIGRLGEAWRAAREARLAAAPPPAWPPDADVEAAVDDFMGDYARADEGGGGGFDRPRVTLSARRDLTSREDVNFETLEYPTVPPEDVDPAAFADDFIGKRRVLADALTDVVDRVFNSGR